MARAGHAGHREGEALDLAGVVLRDLALKEVRRRTDDEHPVQDDAAESHRGREFRVLVDRVLVARTVRVLLALVVVALDERLEERVPRRQLRRRAGARISAEAAALAHDDRVLDGLVERAIDVDLRRQDDDRDLARSLVVDGADRTREHHRSFGREGRVLRDLHAAVDDQAEVHLDVREKTEELEDARSCAERRRDHGRLAFREEDGVPTRIGVDATGEGRALGPAVIDRSRRCRHADQLGVEWSRRGRRVPCGVCGEFHDRLPLVAVGNRSNDAPA